MKIKRLVLILGFAGIFCFSGCEEELFFDDPRDMITGTWEVEEESDLFKKKSTKYYRVEITSHPSDTSKVYLQGFYELPGSIEAEMNGYNLLIPEQTINGFTIQNGYGSISFAYNRIEFAYYVAFTDERDYVTAIYTRP